MKRDAIKLTPADPAWALAQDVQRTHREAHEAVAALRARHHRELQELVEARRALIQERWVALHRAVGLTAEQAASPWNLNASYEALGCLFLEPVEASDEQDPHLALLELVRRDTTNETSH